MDSTYIVQLGKLNRICSDANELKHRIVKENEKLTQITIDQCSSYDKLKEKYDQLESNYQALQQNMLEAQIQNEKISEDSIKEKRRRHEILNKIGSTRQMCDTLTSHILTIEETISNCKADQAALSYGYSKANELLREMKMKYEQDKEKLLNENNKLEINIKMQTESSEQMMKYFEESKREYQSRLSEMTSDIKLLQQQKEELAKELNNKIQTRNLIIEQQKEKISTMESDLKKYIDEVEKHRVDMIGELQLKNDLNENLNKQLDERMLLINEQQKEIDEMKEKLNQSIKEIETLQDVNIKYEEFIDNERKNDKAQNDIYIQKIDELNELLQNKCEELEQIIKEMNETKLDNANKDELFKELKEQYETQKNISAQKDEVLTKAKEQIEKNETSIMEMMNDWKKSKDECCNLNIINEQQFAELKAVKANYSELETKNKELVERAEQIELEMNSAAEIFTNNITDLTAEKEKLEEKVSELQKAIDVMRMEAEVISLKAASEHNISQTLSQPFSQQDNNAVFNCPPVSGLSTPSPESELYVSMMAKKDMYNLQGAFSDSSEDLNLTEMNRLFCGKPTRGPLKRKLCPLISNPPQLRSINSQEESSDRSQKSKGKFFKTKQVIGNKP